MSTTISYQTIESRLPELSETTSAQELGYDLLRIFNGMSETRINRIKDGKDNLSKDGNTIIVKKLLAYSHCPVEKLAESLESLKQNDRVTKTARLLVVSDGETLLGYDPMEEESYENTLERIRYDYQFFMPLAGVERYRAPEEKEADVKAAYKMARIFDEIRRYNEIDYTDSHAIHSLNVFISRLLFCFFAEDTGIFHGHIFTSTLNDFTRQDGSDLSTILSDVFDTMSTDNAAVRASKPAHISRFPYVNGGLFAEHYDVPSLSWKARRLLLECGDLNWAEINPDIFGSMIQAVISPEMRSSLGSHYTSVSNIMKLIQPLFLDELYAEFADSRASEKRLRQLLTRMGRIKFLDPACGSGNFLIITYKELRKLEILIWEQLENINHGLKEIPFSNISLTQFYGIELEEFAHETATLSLWLAEHQMNKLFESRFQAHVEALPLRPSGHIINDNACRLDWNTVCPHTPEEEVYIMGNPPYVGSRKQDESQKEDLKSVFDSDYKSLDYISAWFYLAVKFIENSKGRFAFVSTNSICQGEQVSLLWRRLFSFNVEICFAYNSFKWANNAKFNAGVTVIIVGMRNVISGKKTLFKDNSYSLVDNISPYLTNSNTVFVDSTNTSVSGFPQMNFGNMPADNGLLLFTTQEKDEFIQNNPDTTKFFKPLLSADEFLNGKNRWCIWLNGVDESEYLKYPSIVSIINKLRDVRLKSSRPQLAEVPHLFAQITQTEGSDFVLVPRHSSENRDYIPMGFCDRNYIASDSCLLVAINDIWLFGILTSKMHMAWVKAVGGRLKTDYRYSATLCYNTFPFPKIPEAKRAEIEKAAEAVLMAREQHTEKTLAQMYDPDHMPANLREAHTNLDRVVESCYRTIPFHSDEERLEHLFALYEKMTKK